MNAKEELLEIVQKNNLEILKIDCTFDNDIYYSCTKNDITTLEELDKEYDEGCGSQELFGNVYCIDKETHEPVWLTRGEYDGSEWWEVNRIPEFYLEKMVSINK